MITPVDDGIFLTDVSDGSAGSPQMGESPLMTQSPSTAAIASPAASSSQPTNLRSGTVHSVGPGSKDYSTGKTRPMPVKPGDKVFVDKHADNWIQAGGKKFLHIRPHHIVAKHTSDKSPADGLKKVQKAKKQAEFKAKMGIGSVNPKGDTDNDKD